MKPIILIFSLFFVSDLQAQKLYAFTQRIVPGTRQTTMDKEGNVTVEKSKEVWIHPLYLEIPTRKNIQVTEVWLSGERYAFDTSAVKGPIVEVTGVTIPGQQEKILIPVSNKKILHIMPKEKISVTDKRKRKVTSRKKVVVYYTRNGKTCHRSTNKIEKLPEMLMQ